MQENSKLQSRLPVKMGVYENIIFPDGQCQCEKYKKIHRFLLKDKKTKVIFGSAVEIMKPVAVLDEFLFFMFTGVRRWSEIPDFRCREGRTERTER